MYETGRNVRDTPRKEDEILLSNHFAPLTEEQKKELGKINNKLNPYLSLADGESIEMEFNAALVEDHTDKFNKEKKRFHLYDEATDYEYILDLSPSHAAKITPYLLEGKTMLHVERRGAGTDSKYHVWPVGEKEPEADLSE